MCGATQGIVWNCGDNNVVGPCSTFEQAYSSIVANKCQPRKIGVAPQNLGDTATTQAALSFVKWANNNPIYRSNNTFVFFNSSSSFESFIGQTGYDIDPKIPVYSSAIIIGSAYPTWSYSLRFNQSIYPVSI